MKEIIINVPEDTVELVEELVQRIGGTIEKNENKKKINDKAKGANPKPLGFFGTWPNIPLDPKTYREKFWRKIPEL